MAASHGWSLDGIDVVRARARGRASTPSRSRPCSTPPRSSWARRPRRSWSAVDAMKPTRVVFDTLSEMRLLAQNPLRYRRQILALKQFFIGRDCTVLAARRPHRRSRRPAAAEHRPRRDHAGAAPPRATGRSGGACAWSRCAASSSAAATTTSPSTRAGSRSSRASSRAEHRRHGRRRGPADAASPSSTPCSAAGSVPGTSTLLIGPAGVGKIDAAVRCMVAALERGERAAVLPLRRAACRRCCERSRGARHGPRAAHRRRARLTIQQIDPAELSPGEFAIAVRRAVEERRRAGSSSSTASTATCSAMPEERYLIAAAARAAHLPRPAGVVDAPDPRPARPRRATCSPTSTSATSPTPSSCCASSRRRRGAQGDLGRQEADGDHERTIREFRLDRTA